MRAINYESFTLPAALLPSTRVVAVFDVSPNDWEKGRIRYTCSICRTTDDGGPTHNPSVHAEMREHLKRNHGVRGTSVLRSETFLNESGAISAIEFFRA